MKIRIKDRIDIALGVSNIGIGVAALCKDIPFMGCMCLIVGFWSLALGLQVSKS